MSGLAFLRRHVWSLSLSVIAALCFAQLALEIRDQELGAFDAAVSGVVVHWRGSVDWLMLSLTRLGNPAPIMALTTLLVALLSACSRRREALYLAVCASSCLLLNIAMKWLFQRARPPGAGLYLLLAPTSFSFPSGHAMCSTGVFASLALLAHRLGSRPGWAHAAAAYCVLLLLGVGASRIYFGVHFPSDVLGGQLASVACISAFTGLFYPRLLPGERTLTALPRGT